MHMTMWTDTRSLALPTTIEIRFRDIKEKKQKKYDSFPRTTSLSIASTTASATSPWMAASFVGQDAPSSTSPAVPCAHTAKIGRPGTEKFQEVLKHLHRRLKSLRPDIRCLRFPPVPTPAHLQIASTFPLSVNSIRLFFFSRPLHLLSLQTTVLLVALFSSPFLSAASALGRNLLGHKPASLGHLGLLCVLKLLNLDAHKAEETKLSGSTHSHGDRSRPAVQWSSFKTTTGPPLQLVRHVCSQDHVPCDEEWLREVVLVAVELMMDVMIRGVVPEEQVEDVPGKPQPAVVIYPFDGGEGEEEDGGSGRHARENEGEAAAEGVQEKPFYRVVVLAAEGVWDDEAVVP
ncbi:unnamed protein product [Musa acuminata subsp. burmannicoides]